MKLLFAILLLPFFVISQDFILKGGVVNSQKEMLEFVNVFNKTNNTFTYTNKNGLFSLQCSFGDSLEISHIAYHTKFIEVDKQNLNINLVENGVLLNEVVVKGSSKKKKIKIPKRRIRSNNELGLTLNTDYLFEIKNTSSKKILVSNVNIPIHFRKGYSNEGAFIIQIKKGSAEKFDMLNCNYSYIYQIEKLEKKKVLYIPTLDLILNPNEPISLLLKRVTPNKIFKAQTKYKSVNPFIAFNDKNKIPQNNYTKIYNDKKWYNLSNWFYTVPLFCFQIEGVEIK